MLADGRHRLALGRLRDELGRDHVRVHLYPSSSPPSPGHSKDAAGFRLHARIAVYARETLSALQVAEQLVAHTAVGQIKFLDLGGVGTPEYKIVEAEDLKACDQNGYSDPYVVLCDEYQKRLAKTRIIQKNLNPRWDESVDITVSGPLNVIATIWDHDTFGDHDFVGRTSLKLDPIHFSDYLPREFWLDLDTQGRLLLRVSMEGERDDIRYYFGKGFRHLKRTERDMVRKITDKVSSTICPPNPKIVDF